MSAGVASSPKQKMAEGGSSKAKQPASEHREDSDGEENGNKPGDNISTSQWLSSLMKSKLGLSDKRESPEQLLEELTLDGVANFIKSGKCKNIITMAGAGISTSAGIPDFRSPGTGLYDNLQKYDLPSPQAIFEIGYFRENPEPFFTLAKELYPGFFKPTPCHYFIRLLHEKGLLLRHYTQNIDTLERVAGLDGEKIVEAHGTFHTSHCLECQHMYDVEWMKSKLFSDLVPKCEENDCGGIVKPDIVFFGEALPTRFSYLTMQDMPKCDLLLIMGTSLVVQPFASLANRVLDTTPRLYLNLEKTEGSGDPILAMLGMGHSFRFDEDDNYRDVFHQGDCDSSSFLLAEKLGWKKELDELIEKENEKNEKKIAEEKSFASGCSKSTVAAPPLTESTADKPKDKDITTSTTTTKDDGQSQDASLSVKKDSHI